jgi:hypothetical protein
VFSALNPQSDFPAPGTFDRIDLSLNGEPVDGFFELSWGIIVTGPTSCSASPFNEAGNPTAGTPPQTVQAGGVVTDAITQQFSPSSQSQNVSLGVAINPVTTAATIQLSAGTNFQVLCIGAIG